MKMNLIRRSRDYAFDSDAYNRANNWYTDR